MQRVLTKYGLVIHVALLVLFPVLFLSRSRAFDITPLLWLSLVAVEMMVLLPSVRAGETWADARQRVVRALVQDPFFYVGLAIVGFVLVQWQNSGCKLVYLPDGDVWQFSLPPVAWAPFSVDTRASLAYVCLFSSCVVAALVLRVAASRGPKRLLLQVLAGASGIAALYSVWQAAQGVEPFASKALARGETSMGTFFGFWLLLGLGVFVDAVARRKKWTLIFFALGVLGNLLGVLYFASAYVLLVYVAVAMLMAVYGISYLGPHVERHVQFKYVLLLALTGAGVAAALLFVFPENPVSLKIRDAFPAVAHWISLSAVRDMRSAVAFSLWQDHSWAGIGADGFYHFAGLAVTGKDWGLMKTDPAFVYNDNLQFLCEFGILGMGLLLAAVITLMVPICYRLRMVWKHGTHDENAGRAFLMRLSPVVVVGLLATLLCFIESWLASPFRSYSVLLSWVCVMAVLPSFLPAGPSVAATREH